MLIFRPLVLVFVVDFELDLLAFMYDIDTHFLDYFKLRLVALNILVLIRFFECGCFAFYFVLILAKTTLESLLATR